jgi:hypothetical protein
MTAPDECTCPCHTDRSVHHAMPCCYTCPSCRTPIRYALIDEHFATCPVSDVCTCECHETGALHARPCCMACEVCEQKIFIVRHKSHAMRCPAK